MRFDLKKLLLRGPDHVREEFTADLSGRDWPGYRVSQPVSALFEAWVQGSEVFLELQATAELSGECARCLDPVTQECSLTRSWKVKEHDLAGEDELPVDERGVLDLDELLYQELVLEAPPLLLCSEDCTGLGGLSLSAGRGTSRRRCKACYIKTTAELIHIHIEEVLKNGGTQEKGFQGKT